MAMAMMKEKEKQITLRPATIDDLALLTAWDQEEHVIVSDPDSDWEWEKNLHTPPVWCKQYIAEVVGKAIGFVQIMDPILEEEYHYWDDYLSQFEKDNSNANTLRAIDIWIGEKEYLNKGFGRAMMNQAIDKCFACPSVNAILIDPLASNTDAQHFYQWFGFLYTTDFYFDGDHTKVHRLSREDWHRKNSAHSK